jgi:hypothetical protein
MQAYSLACLGHDSCESVYMYVDVFPMAPKLLL